MMDGKNVSFESFPLELREMKNWVVWRYEKRGNSKPTKTPYDAVRGGKASTADSSTWCAFEKAKSSLLGSEKYSGIGFVLPNEIVGIDLDNVIDDQGNLDLEARDILERIDSYAEISPSGTGLHVLARGKKLEGSSSRVRLDETSDLECYQGGSGRYLTVTGDVFEDHDKVNERLSQIEELCRDYLVREAGVKAVSQENVIAGHAPDAGLHSVDEVLRVLGYAKNAKLRALLDGDISGYPSPSEADLAMCNHLAFYCGRSEELINDVFRRLPIYRQDKWEKRDSGSTHGMRTIRKALSNYSGDFFEWNEKDSSSTLTLVPGGASEEKDDEACSQIVVDGTAVVAPQKKIDCTPKGFVKYANGKLWLVTDRDKPNPKWTLVTYTAPEIKNDLVDIDTHQIRALVGFRSTFGNERVVAVERNVLFNRNKIVDELAPLGANISTTNATNIVSYLTEDDGLNAQQRKRLISCARMGWVKLGDKYEFTPYSKKVRFDPRLDLVPCTNAFKPSGTLAEWVGATRSMRDSSPAFRLVVATSFCSPLVSIVGGQSKILYLWGPSHGGKTASAKAAASIWANPSTDIPNPYVQVFSASDNSLAGYVSFLGNIPLFIDELQTKAAMNQAKRRQAVEQLVYRLSGGQDRSRLKQNGNRMFLGSWQNSVVATGEIALLDSSTMQGAGNRVLEVFTAPFKDDEDGATNIHDMTARLYGTAGRAFIEYLLKNDRDDIRRMYFDIRAAVRKHSPKHPQCNTIALIALADALAEFSIFSPGVTWEEACAKAYEMAFWTLENSTGAENTDTNINALRFVSDWLTMSEEHFGTSGQAVDYYGEWESGEAIYYVLRTPLDKALSDGGYDTRKTFRFMADNDVIERDKEGNYTKRKNLNGKTTRCVWIKAKKLSQLIGAGEEDPDEEEF